ncbi:O-succinylbenzoic acid--CoA ligase, partial [Algibacter sp.]|nr:O-succinylbenzoic acid--CoA ligase [Algibacter sp.]
NFAKYLKNIKTVIVGGGRVSQAIVNLIKDKKPNVYETYGMTETVSHIAVKKLNNFTGAKEEAFFTMLPGIKISKDDRGCLTINAPKLSDEEIITNDMVDIISESSFEWLGRFDNVINSGGIKLYPEQIESKIQDKIPGEFFITSREDDTLGDKLILIVEGGKREIDNSIFSELDKYEKPKEIHFVPHFEETKSGKINRNKTLETLNLA